MKVGYIRVSTVEQNIGRQVKSLEEYGCEKVFIDRKTGANLERDEYHKMKEFIREKDVVVFAELDRLGRTKKDIDNEWDDLINRGIDIVVLDVPILDTTIYKDDLGKLMMNIAKELFGYYAEQERVKLLQRQREGIAIARKKGRYKGRPTKYHPDSKGKDKIIYEKIITDLEDGDTVLNISNKTGVSRNTIYKIKREHEQLCDAVALNEP